MERAPAKLALMAGGGPLPEAVARACTERDIPLAVFDLAGNAGAWAAAHDPVPLALGQVGGALERMAREGCDAVTMAGTLARPNLRSLRFDRKGLSLLPRIAKLMRQGDDALLRGIAGIFEEHGFRVIGPEAFAASNLAAAAMAVGEPDAGALADIERARAILAALGPFDIGQGAVVADGLCLAVEAAEGTAAMLARVADLRSDSERGGDQSGGVLVKLPKDGQDRRIDLPTIGPDTLRAAAGAELAGVAVEAGGAFVLDPAGVRAACEETGVFLHVMGES